MITRGYFIGEIVDALTTVGERIEMRARLGLTDLNRYTEDFVKEVLNRALDLRLENTNVGRANAPGIDLLDPEKGVAFQVTSEKTSKKVNDTLVGVAALEQPPQSLYVLILGNKQGTYSLKQDVADKLGFTKGHIWDLMDLASRILILPLEALHDLHAYVSRELARVQIELELPNSEGEYATSISHYVEELVEPRLGDLGLVREHLVAQEAGEADVWDETRENLAKFAYQLAELPRITREFLAFLIERADNGAPDGHGEYRFDYNRLKRICKYPDMKGEIELLEDAELVVVNEAQSEYDRTVLRIRPVGTNGFTLVSLVDTVKEHGLSLQRLFVSLDFSRLASAKPNRRNPHRLSGTRVDPVARLRRSD